MYRARRPEHDGAASDPDDDLVARELRDAIHASGIDVEAVARRDVRVELDDEARTRVQEARDVIERLVAAGEVVYGVTTGFGDLATTFIAPADAARLQQNLLMSHAAGVGPAFPIEMVRAMLLL
ncbi:MAG: aromatic amino acid lyase, partial [Gemmatimonadales bacterium]